MLKWFILEQEEVVGPLETDEVKTQFRSEKFTPETMIWGRLIQDWIQVSDWMHMIDNIVSQMGIHEDKSRMWHYSLNGETFGPFTRGDLVTELFHVEHVGRTYLWTNGMEDWLPIHEFHDIMDDVGVNQRTHKRAKIEGSLIVTKTSGDTGTGKLATISQGGVGFYGMTDVFPGEEVAIEIISDQLKSHLRVRGEVRYLSENNFIGVKFTKVHSETQSQIIEYVKQAEEAQKEPLHSAA